MKRGVRMCESRFVLEHFYYLAFVTRLFIIVIVHRLVVLLLLSTVLTSVFL